MIGTVSEKSMISKLSFSGSALLSPTRIQATSVRIATLIVALFACFFVQGFATTQNMSAVLFSTVSIGIVACGLALVTISGNLFMLSISATTSISTIVFASTLSYGVTVATLVTLFVGLIFGVIQGVAVGKLKTNAIITTIAASSIITGIGSWYSGGRTISSEVTVPWLGVGHIMPGVPNQIIILALVAIACEFFLCRMRLGREIQLNGINPQAAKLSGLRTGMAITIAYVIASMSASLTGILISSQTSQGNLSLGAGLDFSAIAAVLVGGIAINGGHGKIIDAVFGALFLSVVGNVLLLKGYSLDVQLMVKGAVVIISVILGALLVKKRK
ncbi:ABC transporter permease [Vibrio viridaestus]|uniref:ABC transporter permease n=1 Tax=Vibrio viridaestus TaxID=2487322 RepID=A0A3N9THY9_9VIBR|nr:ABC transporter permease [Vibrio viridaestus]RQW63680.1 ABC transporter permease [Vibrio viridaestus]